MHIKELKWRYGDLGADEIASIELYGNEEWLDWDREAEDVLVESTGKS